jgi:choline dehydrogenase
VGQYATPGFSAGAFFKSHQNYNRPNLQFTMHAYDKHQREWPDDVSGGIMTLEIADNNPWSRGSVSLRSSNPLDPPLVKCGHMTIDSDVQTLMYAIKQARQVIRQVCHSALRCFAFFMSLCGVAADTMLYVLV